MNNKARKILTYIFLIFALLITIGFVANWYLTKRLESYLNKMLSETVSDATDGFYKFSFDSLSIGLFNGELSLRNLELIPDSLVFDEWAKKDSLPHTYFKVHVNSVQFKGVNLTWRFSYQKLNFDLFEIQSPNVEVFDAYSSDRFEEKTKYVESKTLYEMASPYFDAISVKKMNMENASVKYIIEDPIAPSIYALNGINFHAYRFLLDKNSSKNGKLLYFDDFEFSVEKPQVILNTSQLLLIADTIRLNTIDSIIQIKNVNLIPRDTLWLEIHQMPDTYIDAELKAVEVKGAKFSRIEGLNYFEARSFDIISSDIEYFTTKRDSIIPEKHKSDTIIQSLSLHRIISPILHSVAIKNIDINHAKFKYTQTAGTFKNIFTLDELNIHAGNFLIDSLADIRNRYWHSEKFSLDAKGIKGSVPDKNHNVSIARIDLNAMQKYLHIEDIEVSPISTHVRQDYVSGSIQLIALEELVIDKGIEADVLKITNPYIKYFRGKVQKVESSKQYPSDDKNNVFDLISPFLNYFSIKRISLLNADIAYNDKITGDNYRLRNLNAFATNFLINEDTRKESDLLFKYEGFGLSFRNFDNYLPGKDYRLQIEKGGFSTLGDGLRLQNVKLIPQDQIKNKQSGTYLSFESPLIEGKGGVYNPSAKSIDITSFNVHSPKADIVKIGDGVKTTTKSSTKDMASFLKTLHIGNINLNDAAINYLDKSSKDSLSFKFNDLLLKTISWSENDKSNIGEIILKAPHINFAKNSSAKKETADVNVADMSSIADLLGNVISVGKFDITDVDFHFKQPDIMLDIKSEQIAIGNMQWSPKGNNSSFVLAGIQIKSPKIDYNQIHNEKSSETESINSLSKPKQDIYDLVGSFAKNVSINKFDITNASINYTSDLDGKDTKNQKINETNFSIEGLSLDANKKTVDLDDVSFNTKDIRFPIMDGFYTIEVGKIDLNKKKNSLAFEGLYMIPAYSKTEFAYKHPRHKDWFNLSIDNILISGIDLPAYFSNKKLEIKDVQVNNVILENFKNQQIEIQHNIMPMIYEGLQKAPLKLSVDNLDVHNFSVVYEELPKTGTQSGKIFFTEMNGKFTEFTNIVSRPNQFIKLNADGKLMGTGHFTATWMLPVDQHNDNFILKAHLTDFDLRDLNQLITPMATAEVTGGKAKDLTFETNASSKGATVDMLFLYNDLKITVFKDLETKEQQKVYTYIANKALKTNNPDKEGRKPRHAHNVIVRDPYHSTFNYLWQILQPPVVESVGVSQGKQNFVKKVSKVFSSIKNFFSFGKKKKDQPEKEDKKEE